MQNKKLIHFWNSENSIKFYPERWGIIVSLVLWWKEILYQDMLEETLFNPEKSVRGWIPFLFPQAWALTEKEQEMLWYNSHQHGIIRNQKFDYKVFEDKVELYYTNKTSKIPYDFDLKLVYILWDKNLKIKYFVKNNSKSDFAISPWFHPYFEIKNKDEIVWEKAFEKSIKDDSENWKNDGTFRLNAPKNNFSFSVPGTWKITFSYDDSINNFWIWSLSEKDFVCVEPVCGNEGNIVRNPITLQSGEEFWGVLEIGLE